VQRLKDYRLQLKLWAEIAEEGVKNNWSLEQVRDKIIAEDKAMSLVADFIKSHRIYSKTVLENCVRGFIEYAKQKQSS
jgi:protein-tyrosine phosphatase